MSRILRSPGWIPALVLMLSVASPAQAPRPMTLVDLLEVPQLGDPQLSPDGTQALWVLSKADWKSNNRISHIWRIGTDGSGLLQMTNGPRGESGPRWSPDGKLIAFLARREGESGTDGAEGRQIFLIGASGGEAWQLSQHEGGITRIAWSPDGRSIYFLASEPKSSEEKQRDKLKDDVYAYDENFKHTHLWKLSLADKKETQVTRGDYSVTNFRISRDGGKIVLNRAPSPLFGDQELSEVYIMDAAGGEMKQLTRNRVAEGDISLSPDSRQVLFTADANRNFESYYNGNLFLVPADGGSVTLVLPDFPLAIDSAEWSKDGKSIYLLCSTGVRNQLHQFDLATRQVRQITRETGVIGNWSYDESADRHIFTLSSPSNPGEVYLMDGSSKLSQVTRVHDYLQTSFRLPREEVIQWKGTDGVTVEGILTYPLDYREGQRYPLVVNTHGGPASADRLSFSSWSHYRPILAARGWAVLRPNYRGSTGYGNDFLRDMVGHYFRQAHLDVMAGVDYVIQRGIADPDRMVKMGWSAGGHMTNKIITFTDRFKAASSGAGAANWISMYAQSDVRTYRTPWFGGTPWQKEAPISVYWDNSPLKDVWKVKTPTLFLVGERDPRVPMPQSVEMYRALKSNGIETRLYVAPREPHGWGELRHQLFKMNVELEWFEKHALGRSYTWEKAPGDTNAAGDKRADSSR